MDVSCALFWCYYESKDYLRALSFFNWEDKRGDKEENRRREWGMICSTGLWLQVEPGLLSLRTKESVDGAPDFTAAQLILLLFYFSIFSFQIKM